MPLRGAHWDTIIPWSKAPSRMAEDHNIGEKRRRDIQDEGPQERIKRSLVTNMQL